MRAIEYFAFPVPMVVVIGNMRSGSGDVRVAGLDGGSCILFNKHTLPIGIGDVWRINFI